MHKASLAPYQRIILILGSGIVLSVFFRVFISPGMMGTGDGISMYTASLLLDGVRPYSGTWYPLMPGSLLANALALFFHYSVLSVLFLEIAGFFCGAVFLFFALRKKSGGTNAAIAAAFILLFYCLALTAMSTGNSPVTWIVPVAGAFVFFLSSAEKLRRRAFLAGLASGISILILPREITVAVMAAIILKKNKSLFVAGLLTPIIVFTAAVSVIGVNEFFQCVPAYQWALIRNGVSVASLEGGAEAWIKLLCVLSPLILYFLFNQRDGNKEYSRLEKFYIIWLAVEISAAFAPGRMEMSSLIPALIPVSCLWRHRASSHLGSLEKDSGATLLAVLFLISFLTISTHAVEPLLEKHPHDHSHAPLPANHRSRLVVEIIKQTANPGEPVFVWSDSAETNFLSRHAAPTYTPTMVPLLTPGYGEAAIPDYISQIKQAQPRFMVLEASVLPAGVDELLHGKMRMENGAPRKELLNFLQDLLRNEYKILAVKEGVVLCVRKDN